jgi:hypothetical protein
LAQFNPINYACYFIIINLTQRAKRLGVNKAKGLDNYNHQKESAIWAVKVAQAYPD